MKFESVKLGDLYEVHNGLSKGRQYFGEGYPFLSFSTVFNNWFLPESLQDLVRSDEKEQKSYSIHRGDIFITRTSETMDELGMSSVALKDYPQATYNGFVKRLRPISNRVLPEYIGYYLRTPNFRSKFMSLTGSMISRASLRNESLLDMEVLLPSMEEQQKIASYLSVYDDLIGNNQRQIKLLEELQERVYKNEFGIFSFNFDDSVEIMRFKDICDYSRGISYSSKDLADDGDVSLINLKNIRAYGGYNGGAEKYYAGKVSSEQLVMPGSLIMGVTDMTKERRLIGHVAIVPQSIRNAIISMDLIKLIPKIGKGGWLYSLLRYGKLSFLISSYANGVNVLHLRPDTIMDIEVAIPPREQIEQYESFFWNTERQIEILQSEIDIALEGRNKLLQNIFK